MYYAHSLRVIHENISPLLIHKSTHSDIKHIFRSYIYLDKWLFHDDSPSPPLNLDLDLTPTLTLTLSYNVREGWVVATYFS